ncbi:cytochrome c biogenesis protein CcsA, partial [Chlamydiales bacterium]|nr:cytochrome c biogenesis protein CcsA [Chlamydiales bacterium]
SDDAFYRIQMHFKELNTEKLAIELSSAYQPLSGKKFNTISFPHIWQLKLEAFYVKYGMIRIALLFYALAFILYLLGFILKRKSCFYCGFYSLLFGFMIHSLILLMRILILERPPVSSMNETLLFVPWSATLVYLIIHFFKNEPILSLACALGNTLLLGVGWMADLGDNLSTVQPVLNSQFWLTTHVLMVVGSYGIFILAGILGHFWLIGNLIHKEKSWWMKQLPQLLLTVLYTGLILLIGGTLLGGVWASQSWGRFWDWDPKESWAFISILTYLILIHLYTFNYTKSFGLAFGSILGVIMISFTWYGVNYILGTGLHSYGFGSGGTPYYLSYLLIELIFLLIVLTNKPKKEIVPRS